jgi:peptide/nickel transport system ATP-binding protein
MMSNILQVRDLVTAFDTDAGQVVAVDGVSFDVPKGKTLGIVGESGCGKSVTAFSITRLLPQPHGRVLGGSIQFDGKELTTLPHDEMRKLRGNDISMIFQEPMTALNPVQTIGRQLAEAVLLHEECSKSEVLNRSIDLMKKVRIPAPETRLNEYPHQLSGGMRQRVMIAMALINTPKLLIADEPTTALDVTVQAQILDLMKDLQREMGMSIVLITHDLGVIAETCDEVVVMYGGRIVERAEVRQLFAQPRHAYTQGLLSSIPRLDSTPKTRLRAIPGNVPSITEFRTGCRFAERSGREHTEDQLGQRSPLIEVAPGHWVENCGACVQSAVVPSRQTADTPSHDSEESSQRTAQDTWKAALAELGESPSPSGAPQSRAERKSERERQLQLLREWAVSQGKIVDIASLGPQVEEASEHRVFYDERSGCAIKVTISGRCGNTFPNGGLDAALPEEYCRRWLDYNELFGDSVSFVGVVVEESGVSLVVSQRWIAGERPDTDAIYAFMSSLGFSQAPNLRDYYREADQITVLDAHSDNFVLDQSNQVVPIDVHVMPLDQNLRRALHL